MSDGKMTLEVTKEEAYMLIGGLLMMYVRLSKDAETAPLYSYRERAKQFMGLAQRIDRLYEGHACASESNLAMAFQYDATKKKWKDAPKPNAARAKKQPAPTV